MKLKDQFQFIRQNMKKNRMRVFMTVLATAMGCAFLIVLASVAYGLQGSMLKDMMESPDVTNIYVYGLKEEGMYNDLYDEDIARLEDIEGVRAVTRQKSVHQSVTYTTEGYEGSAPTLATHFPSVLASGMELAEGRLPESPNEVVVGHYFIPSLPPTDHNSDDLYDEQSFIKEELRFDKEVLGHTFNLNLSKMENDEEVAGDFPVTVVGIMKKPVREWDWDNSVYITDNLFEDIESFTGTLMSTEDMGELDIENASYDEVYVFANNLESVQGISDQLDDMNYATYSVVSEMKELNMVFTIAKAGLIFIGTIAILIASIGIYNTMTMAVTERAPDIGIMKAIGASPKVIKRIFLLESSYIGSLGAAIGIAVAYVISMIVNIALPMILESAFESELPDGFQFSTIPLSLVLIAMGICLVVTILSGLRPAKRATEIDVLKAMRREM